MNLVKYLYTIVFLGIGVFSYGSADFEVGNDFYKNGEYSSAIDVYESLIDNNEISENLFYNLANAYFKNDELGFSILFYEKTLKVNPENKDAFHNLRLANTKIEDKLEVLPDLFFIAWWKKLMHYFSANNWAWIAIAFSWFSVIAFAFYLFSKNMLLKKSGFLKAFIFGFISIVSLLIAGVLSEKIFKKEEIVLINSSSYGKDAPSNNASKQGLFYEGIKLEVLDEVDGFYKIISSEGITVWVSAEDFRKI